MDYAAGMVPTSTMAGIIISLVLSILIPVAVIVYYKMVLRASMKPLVAGIGIFCVFALLLEQIVHYLVLGSSVGTIINAHPFMYAGYGALAASLFEEVGRIVGFSFFLKKYDDVRTSVMYGAGHGGMEAIVIGGMSMVSNLAFGLALNSMGSEKFLNTVDQSTVSALKESINIFYTSDWTTFTMAGVERCIAFFLQIGMSVLIFVGLKNIRKRYLILIAFLVHFIADFPAGLYQAGTIDNLWMVEGWVLIVTIVVGIFAYRQYQLQKREGY